MAGFILVLMGIGKLGRLIEIIPYPVTIGFTSGIGVVIATFQIKDFLGLNIEVLDGHYLDKLSLILHALPSIDWQESLIGVLTLMILLVWPKLRSKVPVHLVALLVGSISAWMISYFLSEFSSCHDSYRFSYEVNDHIRLRYSAYPACF